MFSEDLLGWLRGDAPIVSFEPSFTFSLRLVLTFGLAVWVYRKTKGTSKQPNEIARSVFDILDAI